MLGMCMSSLSERMPSSQDMESLSRISRGAVLWFIPRRIRFMGLHKVMDSRKEQLFHNETDQEKDESQEGK